MKPFTPEQRAKKAAYMRKYRLTENGKAYYFRYHRSPKGKAQKRRSEIKTTYGITIEEYEDLLAKQKGGCAICGQSPDIRRLAIDHNHSTGRVRGLLCAKHNVAIGILESPEYTELRAYLDRWEIAHRRDPKE